MSKLSCNDVTIYAAPTICLGTVRVTVEAVGELRKWTYEFRKKAYCLDPTLRQVNFEVFSRETKRHKYKPKEGRLAPPSEVFEPEVIRKVVEAAVVALAKHIRLQFLDVVGYLAAPVIADTTSEVP